jgi:hypothetical protein
MVEGAAPASAGVVPAVIRQHSHTKHTEESKMSVNRLANQISPKQENFIKSLCRRADNLNPLDLAQQDYLGRVQGGEWISKDQASYLISGLLQCDQKPRGEMAKPGYYVTSDGRYLVVVENRRKTATYAKRLEVTKERGRRAKARWVYAPGEGAEVAHMTPMTLTEAAKFGHLHGVCFVCTRALTDPASVKRGIGPTCAKKFRR